MSGVAARESLRPANFRLHATRRLSVEQSCFVPPLQKPREQKYSWLGWEQRRPGRKREDSLKWMP